MKEAYFAHPSAIVDEGAKIGLGTKLWHGAHVMKTAVIGNNCTVGQNCFVAGRVGNNCKLQNNVNIYEGVEIKDWVFCGPSMTFTNDLNPRAKYPKQGKYMSTTVGEGATLGANSTIVCGVSVGSWAFVGAGSVVTHDIPNYALAYGNPASIKGWICECGSKLPLRFELVTCASCRRRYRQIDKVVQETK
jgi:UDP-2-acetamido-3-amino-2,3-dideoxy-glucuronate N-acetyltransferase